jgi:environmental stress-induced protein Ves
MMKKFTREEFRVMPWKNGGGTTTELFRLPDVYGEDFLLRISIAQVSSSGPFSSFPDIDRHLLILNGNGCILNGDKTLSASSPVFSFPGELKINCELIDGAFSDFNVMIKRGWKQASLSRKKISSCSVKGQGFAYLIDSEILYQLENETVTFPEQDCIEIRLT